MSSDEYYYSSDSEPYIKPSSNNNSVKKPTITPSKSPLQGNLTQSGLRRPMPNAKRPIPGRSPSQNSIKTPLKKFSPNSILSSTSKKKIQIPVDSDSGSYYEYDSETDGAILSPPANSTPKNTIRVTPKPTPKFVPRQTPNQTPKVTPRASNQQKIITPQKTIKEPEENIKEPENPKINESLSPAQILTINQNEFEFQDTNEEPQIKLNEETIKLVKKVVSKPLQKQSENLTDVNLPDSPRKEKVIYTITRNKSQLSHYAFKLLKRDQCLMTASSSNTKKLVDFKIGENSHAQMAVSKNRRQFNLKSNGAEIMSTKVSTIKEPFFYDRFFTVDLKYPGTNKRDLVLKSLLPRLRPDGKFSMNFEGKFTKRSIKNAVLINYNDERIIVVRRIGESQLEIEADPLVNELWVFAFGVISWICPF